MLMKLVFVDTIPKAEYIDEGHFYVSIKYGMTMHRCASGCGQLVPLPLSPVDWSIKYNGETVTLNPSVGNGVLSCNSHYRIVESEVVWSMGMSEAQIERQKKTDEKILIDYINVRKKNRKKSNFLQRFIDGLVGLMKN